MLQGVVSHSESDVKPGVVLLHPHPLYGGNMNNHVITTLELVFLEAGFTTLRFDFRGALTSPQGYSGVSGAVTDALNAVEFLKSSTDVDKVGIVGYSFGASTAMRLALLKPPPFLITLSASQDLVSEGGFETKQLINIECPVMMYHGKSDQMIPFDDLITLAEAIRLDPTNAVLLEDEGHFYQRSLLDVVTSIREFIRNLYA
jgi:alpha/beta superfamily hydrolase